MPPVATTPHTTGHQTKEISATWQRPLLLVGIAAAFTLMAAACGSTSDDDANVASTTTSTELAAELPRDLPESASDLKQLCETGAGFGDLTEYDGAAPGPHPVLLFAENSSGSFSSPHLEPREWTVGTSDIALAELVACARLSGQTPNGGECNFESGDGTSLTLQLVDVVYDVEMYAAASGESIGSFQIEGSGNECPTGLLHNYVEGQTEYLNVLQLDFDEAATADSLESYVAP